MSATLTPNTTATVPSEIDQFNSLLRGELSAVETYQQALSKFEDPDTLYELSRIRDEHLQATSQLRGRILALGGKPATGSGLWGSFVAMVTGTAKVIGPETVLVALNEGEEIGFGDYETALEGDAISAEGKAILQDNLMSRSKNHILSLHRLLADYRRS